MDIFNGDSMTADDKMDLSDKQSMAATASTRLSILPRESLTSNSLTPARYTTGNIHHSILSLHKSLIRQHDDISGAWAISCSTEPIVVRFRLHIRSLPCFSESLNLWKFRVSGGGLLGIRDTRLVGLILAMLGILLPGLFCALLCAYPIQSLSVSYNYQDRAKSPYSTNQKRRKQSHEMNQKEERRKEEKQRCEKQI
ncbi:hypothetical protein FPQ18DRAFT_307500 [Pyronema domesticum]|nr:hypothetical protein FPQ18DRAFT_307500 [Pyronema domesticum]